MVQRKQDDLTTKFLFSIMEEVMEEQVQSIRQEATPEERTFTEQGHIDASIALLAKVETESNAMPQEPVTGEGWAKHVLERVDALPKEAKPVLKRRVVKRRVVQDLPAQHHGHTEYVAVPANRAKNMRRRAVRRKSVLRQ
jgi:hypothetical protein